MNLLTLETTCDETAAAVVTDDLRVLSSVVASQDELHQRFGGVVPEIASRAHLERILPVIDEAVRRAGLRLDQFDAVAVANQPGLAGSLLVGLSAAKALALARKLGWKFDIMSTSFFLSRRSLKLGQKTGPLRFWQDRLFIRLARNASDATEYFHIPTGRVVEIGTQVII